MTLHHDRFCSNIKFSLLFVVLDFNDRAKKSVIKLMSNNKQNIICYAIHRTSTPTMETLARAIKKQGIYEPTLILSGDFLGNPDLYKKENINYISLNNNTYINSNLDNTKPSDNNNTVKVPQPLFGRFKAIVMNILTYSYRVVAKLFEFLEKASKQKIMTFSMYHLMRGLFSFIYLKVYSLKINKLLDTIKPKAVYIYRDTLGGSFAYFASECKKRNIKIILVMAAYFHPDTTAFGRYENFALRADSWLRSPWINYLIKKYLPNQYYHYKGVAVQYLFAYELIALFMAKCLAPYPWVNGKNFADTVCVFDSKLQKDYQALGIAKENIKVVGHIDCDLIHLNLKNKSKAQFFKELDFDPNKKCLVLALPQIKEHDIVESWEEHWVEIEFLVKHMTNTGHNVLLAMHPKMDLKRYEFLENKYTCKIYRGKTADTIGYADVMVTAGSSTSLWAVQSGVVVINLGFYGWSIEQFSFCNSIKNIYDRNDWPAIIEKTVNDNEYFLERKTLVEFDQKQYFLPLDGKNMQRHLELIES
ncbi:hypothetical protein BVY03_03985 [bacterium K02(2017)]|nr:hypothetical protein BVY03_03985 [bacterium K02(2017)]